MRAVLDTNVVMSAIFFGGDPKTIVRAAVSKRVELVATKAVLAEYHEVAERLHEHYPAVSFRRPLAILESIVKLVRPATLGGAVCRDPDDDAIIACALGGKAKIICSGDDDLLALNGFRGLEILKPREFKTRYLTR